MGLDEPRRALQESERSVGPYARSLGGPFLPVPTCLGFEREMLARGRGVVEGRPDVVRTSRFPSTYNLQVLAVPKAGDRGRTGETPYRPRYFQLAVRLRREPSPRAGTISPPSPVSFRLLGEVGEGWIA